MASGDVCGVLRVWDVATLTCLRTFTPPPGVFSGWFGGICALPDGIHVLSGHEGPTFSNDPAVVRLWNLESGTIEKSLEGHSGKWVSGVDVLPDGSLAVSAGSEGSVRVWNLTSGACELIMGDEPYACMTDVCFLGEGERIVAGDDEGFLWCWNRRSGDLLWKLAAHRGEVSSVRPIRGDTRFLSAGDDGAIQLWNAETGTCERTFTIEGQAQWHLFLSVLTDGEHVVSAGTDKAVRLWRLADGECVASAAFDESPASVAVTEQDIIVIGDVIGGMHFLQIDWQEGRLRKL